MKHLSGNIICLLILIGISACIDSTNQGTNGLSTGVMENITDGKNIIAKYHLWLGTEHVCSWDPNATVTYKKEGNNFTVVTECVHFFEEREVTESMFNQSIFANDLENSGIKFRRLKEEDYCMQSEDGGTTFCSNSDGILTYIYTYGLGFVDTDSSRTLIEYKEE